MAEQNSNQKCQDCKDGGSYQNLGGGRGVGWGWFWNRGYSYLFTLKLEIEKTFMQSLSALLFYCFFGDKK